MIRLSHTFEIITPCFCAGADPFQQAEIRPASIRGQLRWWFRTLGGFASLAPMPVAEQECLIFGTTAGDEGTAGQLTIRVTPTGTQPLSASANHPEPQMNTPEGYLLFPLRQQPRKKSALSEFKLIALWRGSPTLKEDLQALFTVFGNLGALGFRSRRAMGALSMQHPPSGLAPALARFHKPGAISVFAQTAHSATNATTKLATWLRGWRQHGRSSTHKPCPPPAAPPNPGFDYALRDHDEGLQALGRGRPVTRPSGRTPKGNPGESFKPALGMPIVQFYSSIGGPRRAATVDWNASASGGRFASPILLRPHKLGNQWRALVIFLEDRQWDYTQPVHLSSGTPRGTRRVLPGLYQEMKKDAAARMTPYP